MKRIKQIKVTATVQIINAITEQCGESFNKIRKQHRLTWREFAEHLELYAVLMQ